MLSILFAAAFAILLGTAFTFIGYRVFLVLLPIWGFFAGFWLGAEVINIIFGTGFLATAAGFIAGLAVGVIMALLSYIFYMVGVVLIAATVGYAIGAGLMVALGLGPGLVSVLVGVFVAVVVMGITLLLNVQKYVIIVLTAFAGANAILLGILILFNRVSLESIQRAGNAIRPVLQDSWLWTLAWLVVTVAGIWVQIRANRTYTFEKSYYVQSWG